MSLRVVEPLRGRCREENGLRDATLVSKASRLRIAGKMPATLIGAPPTMRGDQAIFLGAKLATGLRSTRLPLDTSKHDGLKRSGDQSSPCEAATALVHHAIGPKRQMPGARGQRPRLGGL